MDASSYVEIKPNRNIPSFRTGDTVRVHAKVVEGERQRIQVFEGVVIRIRKGGINSNFTVRRVSHGIGVERVFPYHSPLIDKVEVSRVGRVRRSRLYYLRDRVGRSARIRAGERERFEDLAAELAAGAEVMDEEELEEEAVEAEEGAEAEAGEEAPEAEASEEPAAEAEEAAEEPVPEASEEEVAEEEAEAAPQPAAEGAAEEPVAELAEPASEASEEAAEEEAEAAPQPAAEAEAEAVVEEPETPEEEAAEQVIETESGEEPGEAIEERK